MSERKRYDRVFWLEDHPDNIVEQVVRLCMQSNVSREDILSRITFAHEYHHGSMALECSGFDLHMLDSDFPYYLQGYHPEHAGNIWQCLKNIREGTWPEDGVMPTQAHDQVRYHFVRFYLENREHMKGPAVVFSGTMHATYLAYQLGLPFYSKGFEDSAMLRQLVHNFCRKPNPRAVMCLPKGHEFREEEGIEGWECGSKEDLVLRYLV